MEKQSLVKSHVGTVMTGSICQNLGRLIPNNLHLYCAWKIDSNLKMRQIASWTRKSSVVFGAVFSDDSAIFIFPCAAKWQPLGKLILSGQILPQNSQKTFIASTWDLLLGFRLPWDFFREPIFRPPVCIRSKTQYHSGFVVIQPMKFRKCTSNKVAEHAYKLSSEWSTTAALEQI